MPPFLSEMLSQVKGIWARLDAGQRLTIGVILLATISGLGAIVWFAGQPDYQAVFSSAESRERMQAQQALDRGGVSYRIEGSAITVERGQIESARRALNGSGLGSSASESGSIASMTADRATRTHQLAREVERDTERKLMAIVGVTHAQVSHSKPKRSPYTDLDNETQPRASIGLQLRSGVSFIPIAKAAVQSAAAALAIPPEFITVTNLSTMQTYASDREAESGLDTSEFLRQQRQRSDELTMQAQAMLDRAYPNKAVVRVTVVLDPEWRVLNERGAPDKQLIKRTITTKESTNDNVGGASSGDPSAANGPGSIGTQARSQPGSTKSKESKETEYAGEGYRETRTGRLAPDIKKMTVAVIVDEEIVPDAAKEQELQALVKNSIGWSAEWSDADAFTIHKTAIPDVPEIIDSGDPGMGGMLEQYGPLVGQVIAVAMVLLFLRGLLKKSQPAPRNQKAGKAGKAGVPGAAPVVPDAELEPEIGTEDYTRKMRRDIEEAIATDPSSMSRLLESWMLEAKP